MNRKIKILISFLIIVFTIAACNENIKLKNCSEEFSKDVIELISAIENDISNKTNMGTYKDEGGKPYEFYNKYKDKILSKNEKNIINTIDTALMYRQYNFLCDDKGDLLYEYDDGWDKKCIDELSKIKDLIE